MTRARGTGGRVEKVWAKLVVQLVLGVWPGVWWAELHSLRVLYLHLMLLGFVTLGLVAAAGCGRRRALWNGSGTNCLGW